MARSQGLVSVGKNLDSAAWGEDPASSRVPSGDGGDQAGLLQARVSSLLPPQVQGLLLLTQPLPPSGRSCWFLDSQDHGLPGFRLRRGSLTDGKTEALAGTWLISFRHSSEWQRSPEPTAQVLDGFWFPDYPGRRGTYPGPLFTPSILQVTF